MVCRYFINNADSREAPEMFHEITCDPRVERITSVLIFPSHSPINIPPKGTSPYKTGFSDLSLKNIFSIGQKVITNDISPTCVLYTLAAIRYRVTRNSSIVEFDAYTNTALTHDIVGYPDPCVLAVI